MSASGQHLVARRPGLVPVFQSENIIFYIVSLTMNFVIFRQRLADQQFDLYQISGSPLWPDVREAPDSL